MNRIFALTLWLILPQVSWGTTYYIASNGNDASNGYSPSTAFQSIGKLNQLGLAPGDSILFNRGDLFRGTLLLQNSGTAGKPIYIGAYGNGGLPILSGAEIVTGFTQTAGNIYQANCPNCPDQLQQVFINNLRHIPARYPNSGYFPMTNVNNSDSTFSALNLTEAAGVWDSVSIFLRTEHWVIDEFLVKDYTPQQIKYSVPPHFYTSYAIQENFGFFLSNKFIALDSIGEWFFNNISKQLFIIPVNSDSLINNGAEVSIYSNCILFSNGVQYITIENIQMEKSLQDAISMNQTSHIIISKCNIIQAGRDGVGGFVDYSAYNSYLTVQNCVIKDICNTGIDLGNGTNINLNGNTLSKIGLIPGLGSGFDGAYGGIYCPSYSSVKRNRLDSIGYTAIRISSYDTAMYNYCTNYGLTKNDCGGIYFWSGAYNYVAYNITGNGYGNGQGTIYPDKMMTNGIYSDDYSNNNLIEHNTSYANEMGIMIHNTASSTIRNNICYDNRRAQLYFLEGNPHNVPIEVHGNNATNNVLQCIHPSQKALTIETDKDNLSTMTSLDSNWYCNPYQGEVIEIAYTPLYNSGNSTFRYNSFTLKQWQSAYGFDPNSHVAFDYPSSYGRYSRQGSNLIPNSNFSSGIGWWWTYGNTNFSIVAAPANSIFNSPSLNGQYQNPQTLSPGNWGVSSITSVKDKQYILSYDIAGANSGGLQLGFTFNNIPYTRNATPTLISKSFTNQLKTDTFLFTATYSNMNSLGFNSSSFDGNFWMDNVTIYEVNIDTSNAYPHTISQLFTNPSYIPLTLSTAGQYRNLDESVVTTDLVLPPFTSIVLKSLFAVITLVQKQIIPPITINVFPNPVSDKLFIQDNDLLKPLTTVRILDLRGMEFYHGIYNNTGINIPTQMTNGVYILMMNNGNDQSVAKFIINR